MKKKKLSRVELGEFVALLNAKREAEAVAREAVKAFKAKLEKLDLPSESLILVDGTWREVVATFNERNVAASAARVDRFHNFNVVEKLEK